MSAQTIRPQTIIDDLPEEDIELSVEELMVIVGGMRPLIDTGCGKDNGDNKTTNQRDCDR